MSKIVNQVLETARIRQRAQNAEIENKRLMAILEYVAMMADIDIEDEQEDNSDAQQNVL